MTFPDGEKLNYSYNTAGLLTTVSSSTNIYVRDIKYDKYEQRTYMKYGNGTETNYSYDALRHNMTNMSVFKSGTGTLMDNIYTYDNVNNVLTVTNNANAHNGIGGAIAHNYTYDNLYRLKSANGTFTGGGDKTATYTLAMGYDDMHNIISKEQNITQNNVQFAGTLNAGYKLSYKYAGNCQQIANIADQNYRYAAGESQTPVNKQQAYSYDANGNLIMVAMGTMQPDSTILATNTRRLLWDEENRLLGINDNGFVSNYWYDAAGERTVKESFDNEGVQVNGVQSAGRTGTSKFTAYVSPYMVVSNGGNYTKHIYVGSQRITSKVSNSGIFTASPVKDTLQAKYATLTTKIKERFDSLGVAYNGTAQTGGLISSSPSSAGSLYYYHSDHLESSSLITDDGGNLVQHVEYVPFGETFIDERNGSWHTPYLFNAKEQDEETGLHYYGARYYDSRTSVWLSVDPLAEKYMNVGSYVYCHDNPVNYIDPTGMGDEPSSNQWQIPMIQKASYTNPWASPITFVNNACTSVLNGGISLVNSAVHAVEVTAKEGPVAVVTEAAQDIKATGQNIASTVEHIATTPVMMQASEVKDVLTDVNFWEDFAGATGTMLAGGALAKAGSPTTTPVATTSNEQVFWSGGNEAKNAAMKFAKANGMKTLEMTPTGKVMNTITPILPKKVSTPIWNMLSSNFAKKATGTAHFFTTPLGPRPTSIWLTVEKPILKQNNVRIINHH
jgi:RHS repeat-associated protein